MSVYYTFYCYNHEKFDVYITGQAGNDLLSYQEITAGREGNAVFRFSLPDVVAINPTFTLYGLDVEPGYMVKLSRYNNGDAIANIHTGTTYVLDGGHYFYDLTAVPL